MQNWFVSSTPRSIYKNNEERDIIKIVQYWKKYFSKIGKVFPNIDIIFQYWKIISH